MNVRKSLFLILMLIFVSSVAYATTTPPIWNGVNEKLPFFKENGFTFETFKLPKNLYKKEMIELTIVIPEAVKYEQSNNTFSNVLLLNDEIEVDVLPFDYSGKKRVIITLSTAMAEQSELCFCYKNLDSNVTPGTQFRLKVADILEAVDNK